MSEKSTKIGIVLSSASTKEALCQLIKESEVSNAREGMLVIIESIFNNRKREILCRIEEIRPIDESYERGGFLTEAIREQKKIPLGLSRKFVVATLDILFELGPPRRETVYPPSAGDEVFLITDVDKFSEQIFGIGKEDFSISLGTLAGYSNLPVLLDMETISMHIGVFGTTGSGKSYNYGAFIEKICNIEYTFEGKTISKHVPHIVIDPNGDYVDYWEHFIQTGSLGKYPSVIRYVFSLQAIQQHLPLNFKKNPSEYYKLFNIDLNEFKNAPRELSESIVTFYGGDLTGRMLQVNGLSAILKYIIDKNLCNDLNALFFDKQLFDNILKNNVMNPPNGISISGPTRPAIERQLDLFRNEIIENYKLLGKTRDPFSHGTIDELVNKGGMHVIDFSSVGAPGVPLHVKQFIVHYISYVLLQRFVHYKSHSRQQKVLLFTLEESQNYCPNLRQYPIGYSLAKRVLQRIATQGRKFGLCLSLISQRPSFVDPVVLSMCNTFFIQKIAHGDQSFVRGVTGGLPGSLERRLCRLERGELLLTGQMVKSGIPLLVNIVKDKHRKVPQKAGKVDILNGLPGES